MKMKAPLLALGLGMALPAGLSFGAGDQSKTGARTQTQETNKNDTSNTKSTTEAQSDQSQATPIVIAEVWTVYLDRMEKEAVTVNFPKGSAELSASDQARLRELVPAWQQDKKIDKLIVAAWADEPYPAAGKKLSKSARDLAEKRADNVEKFLDKLGVNDVDTYSMAEKPNWFQKAFGTDAAQIKGAAANKHWDSLNEDRIQKIVDSKGGPSKAVIILKRDFDQSGSAS